MTAEATTERGSAAPTIVVDGLSKWYGSVVAVNEVSFNIYPGVTGLLGPNGAGKTTLLHSIAGLCAPSAGEVRVLGEPVRGNPAIYARLGVMTEHESVYGFLTGRDFVTLNARLQGVDDVDAAVDRAIEIVDMAEAQDRALGGYSRGMRQRMRLAAALVHDPPVLLLDEPLSGTDPRQRLHFQELVRAVGAAGRTVVISSHILEEIEVLADRIVLLVAGKVAAAGDYRAIRQKPNERPYVVRVEADAARVLAAALIALDAVESVSLDDDGALRVLSRDVVTLQRALPRVAQQHAVRLLRVEPLDDSLESVFEYLSQQQTRGTR